MSAHHSVLGINMKAMDAVSQMNHRSDKLLKVMNETASTVFYSV